MPAARPHARWLWVAAAISVATLIAVATSTGLTAPEIPPGLPTPPAIATWALPVLQLLRNGAGILVVGFVLVGGLLAPGVLRRFLLIAASWCAVWIIVTLMHAILSVADIFALPVSTVIDPGVFGVFLIDTIPGRVAAYQIVAALISAGVLIAAHSRRLIVAVFVLTLTAVSAPAFSGHAGLGGGHESATASLGLHIGSLAVWVGGLVATTVYVIRKYPARDAVVRKFSAIALWCVIIAVETGLINASLRLPTWNSMFTTTYGQLILAKAVILSILIWLGWLHRRRIIPTLSQTNVRPFLSLAFAEVGIMAVALALSVVLARTNPDAETPVQNQGISLFWIAVLGTGLLTYLYSYFAARRRGIQWPIHRLIAAGAAFVVLLMGTSEASGSYSNITFGVHVLQTTLLTFAVPTLVVVALPMVLRTRLGQWLRRYPEAVAIGMIFVFYQVIFSPFYAVLMATHEGHLLMQITLLGAGFAFVVAVVDRSLIAIAIPMLTWPFILVLYPTPQALANVLLTELLLVALFWRTWMHRPAAVKRVDSRG